MRALRQLATGLALCALVSSSAWAQTQGAQNAQPPTDDAATRPATTTVFGDTGLWFVPTGETLPRGRWSVSGYRTNWDRTEAFSDISNLRGTFAFGATDRLELFGTIDFQRRNAARRRPVREGGTPMGDPNIQQGWQTGFGDVNFGGKFNVTSPWREQPAAFAIRAMVKLPTSQEDEGVGTGRTDFLVDAIISGEAARAVELSAFGGIIQRGNPEGYDLSGGFRWGVGAGFPSRNRFRITTEVVGERYFDDTISTSRPNGAPLSWRVDSPVDFIAGFTYQTQNGFFIGWGASFGLNTTKRDDVPGAAFTELGSRTFDRWGNQVRIGWHPGVRQYVAPAPPPAPPAPPENRPPTVKARCEPCVVEVGKASTVTADAQDPDGDPLTYKWSAPAGTFANPADRQTTFTCPPNAQSVQVTVTVSDGRGGTATDTITIQCVEPKRPEWKFEDVHFDFDRYSLRPEAIRLLDEAVKALQADNTLRLTIEGHTDSIGTNEYNLALGERRANSVREYLVGRGIAADRLNIVSYGEERPKHDNTREETRRLNRRAALVVRLTQ